MKKRLVSIVLGAVMAVLQSRTPRHRKRPRKRLRPLLRMQARKLRRKQLAKTSTSVSSPVLFPSLKMTDAAQKHSRQSMAKRTSPLQSILITSQKSRRPQSRQS